MNRKKVLLLMAGALSVVQAAWPASPARSDADGMQAQSVPHLRLQFSIATPLPAGSILICKARFLGSRDAGVEAMAAGKIGVRGSSAACAVEVPLLPGYDSAEGGVVRYEIDAEQTSGVSPRVVASGSASLTAVPAAPALELKLRIPF